MICKSKKDWNDSRFPAPKKIRKNTCDQPAIKLFPLKSKPNPVQVLNRNAFFIRNDFAQPGNKDV